MCAHTEPCAPARSFPREAGKAKPIDVVTGFLDQQGNAHGRPVDVTADAQGALLVSDDVGGIVWRVTKAQ